MSDLIDLNFGLTGVLNRLGIRFGFGEKTVEEVCRAEGIDTGTFLLICSYHSFDHFVPSSESLDLTDLRGIVNYLHLGHSYYLNVALKDLEAALETLISPCSQRYKDIIRKFFSTYREELTKHFDYEERQVFPYVEAVLSQQDCDNFSIGQYEKNHSNIEEKLEDLKSIVMKYLPAECSSTQVSDVLFRLYILREDLRKHTRLEDEVLIPIVNKLEGQKR